MQRGPSGAALLLVFPLVACLAAWSPNSGGPPPTPSSPSAALERQTHAKVNAYRASRGLATLTWSDVIADQARRHSTNMATGVTDFGHDGFDERAANIAKSVAWTGVGENVCMVANQPDPVTVAVNRFVDSRSHRRNIEGDFDMTGIGIARASDGSVYFTQIFLKSK
jgi:uncharacterized protein YkwD